MGLCHENHGNVSIETRRDGFKIHYTSPWVDESATFDERFQHMEISYEDLDDLEKALSEMRKYRAERA